MDGCVIVLPFVTTISQNEVVADRNNFFTPFCKLSKCYFLYLCKWKRLWSNKKVSENKKIHTFCWKLIPRPMIKVNLHNICILRTIIWWLHLWVKSKYLIGILDGGRKCYKYFATVREYQNCMVAQPACWIWNLFWE